MSHLAYPQPGDLALFLARHRPYHPAPENIMHIRHKLVFPLLIAVLALGGLPACSAGAGEAQLEMTPMKSMPSQVQSAPATVQQAYQFASANPDLMKNIPCYCGCGNIGHTSNYSCYVSDVDTIGNISFDNHALGCSLCVDITQDVMRSVRQGRSQGDIRASIDAIYSKYGPSNIP
jgi:hypothetical protein